MSISKQFLKSRPECKVKFRVSAENAGDVQSVALVGDFNDWDQTATPMDHLKSGDFTATLYLDLDRRYAFRYLADGSTWMNDEAADDLTPTEFPGEMNSVIDTTAP
ncbi:MAG: isoamylase early set domain-containing protein [Anaerolineae bacterium]|nr:isoamylase early set domain-containing protein [Anaerolineae bacterium]